MPNLHDALRHFLDPQGRLTAFPAKRAKKLPALLFFAQQLEPGRRYTEAELGDCIDAHSTFHDPATIRRELYVAGLVDRLPDGSAYWLAPTPDWAQEWTREA